MSPELKEALRKWLELAEDGSGKPKGRVGRAGLCLYVAQHHDPLIAETISSELGELFAQEFPENWLYPFGGQTLYKDESCKGIAHLNPLRLAWVRRKLFED